LIAPLLGFTRNVDFVMNRNEHQKEQDGCQTGFLSKIN
jgi:hypothetical protein